MFRKAHQSIWSILSLLTGKLYLVDIVRHLVKSDPLKPNLFLISMVRTFTAVFGHFQTTNQCLHLFHTSASQ